MKVKLELEISSQRCPALTFSTTEEAFRAFKVAYDAGVNFFDTAENYSAGRAEIILGKAIKKFGWKQNDLVISTKVNSLQAPTVSMHTTNKVLVRYTSDSIILPIQRGH
jgi:aryl-alcohol dehydrogenase-like predicted oxidoreductase